MNCGISLAGRKKYLQYFTLKFYHHRPKENKERKLCKGATETSIDLLSACQLVMEFHSDAMLHFNLHNDNSDAGWIK